MWRGIRHQRSSGKHVSLWRESSNNQSIGGNQAAASVAKTASRRSGNHLWRDILISMA